MAILKFLLWIDPDQGAQMALAFATQSAHMMSGMWTAADIAIAVDDDNTDDPVVTAEITTPAGRLDVMAEVRLVGNTVALSGLHIQGEDVGPGEFGAANLRRLADAVMELLECHELIVEGAVRQSGANPGHLPARLRFKRRLRPQSEC